MKRIVAATKKRWRLAKAAKAGPARKKAAVSRAEVKAVPAKAAKKSMAVNKAARKPTAKKSATA